MNAPLMGRVGYAHALRAPLPAPKVSTVVDGELHVAWVAANAATRAGACDLDWANAVRRTLGEYAERLSHLAAAELVPILATAGADAVVEPAALLASAVEWPRHWIAGVGLSTGTSVAVPAQAVLLGWEPPPPERRWWVQTSVGTAAAAGHDEARLAALREVLERHTLGLGWRSGDIRFEDLRGVHEEMLPLGLLAALHRHEVELLTVRVVGVRPDVVLSMLFRAGGEALTCGAAVRDRTGEAVVHAVCEAVGTRLALRGPRRTGVSVDRDRERALSVARAGRRHLRFVTERLVGTGTSRTTPTTLADLVDAAERMFAGQPVDVELSPVGDLVVHRVVCPGSAVFEPLGASTGLSSPIV